MQATAKITARGAVLNKLAAEPPYAQSRPLTIDTVEIGQPGAGEISVRMEAASICHSDLSVVNGSRPRPTPMLLGHEACGIITQVGDGVADMQVGDRVILTFLPRCGECKECLTDGKLPCSPGSATNNAGTLLSGSELITRNGQKVFHHLGCSGFAEHAVVDARSVVPIAKDVPAEIAAVLGCAVLTGGGAVLNAAKLKPEDSIAIVGLGGVGMAALLTALAIEPNTVIAVDANPEKLEMALEWGATSAYTPQQLQEAQKAGQTITADVVIEAAGHQKAFETAYSLIGFGGTLITVGLPAPDGISEIAPLQLTAKAQTVIGSYLGSAVPRRDIPKFADLWRQGKLPLEKLITGTVELEQINEAMDALATGKVLRQIIKF